MSGKEKSKEDSKREQILDAAATIFCHKGYYKAKVEEIAKEAEVGKGTVYEYFKSKKDLFQQMIVECNNAYFKNFDEYLQGVTPISERLRLIIKTHLESIKGNRKIANVLVAEHHLLGEEFQNWFMKQQQEKIKNIQGVIQSGIESGEFREMDIELAAEMVSGLIFSIGGYLFKDPTLDIDKIVSAAMEIILEGIQA